MIYSIRFIQIFLLFFVGYSLPAQGVLFEGLSWQDALTKAKAEDKLIFVDAYADWCGPCKQMDKDAFPDADLGNFYNQTFVNLKINVEKGEGWKFAEKYKVQALPTLFYINGDGQVVHKSLGMRSAVDLVLIGKEAIHPVANLKYFQDNYQARKNDPEFLKTYVILLKNLRAEGGVEMLDEYLRTQSDWNNEQTIPLIYEFVGLDLDDKKFKYMIDNKETFYQFVGEEEVDDRIKYAIEVNYGIHDNEKLLAEKFNEFFPVKAQRFIDEWKLRRLLKKYNGKASDEFVNFAISFFDKYEMYEWNQLNNLAWNIYEVTSDKDKLHEAKEMAQRSVDLNSNYYNNDTLAAILYKLRDAAGAKIYALQAISEARKMGLDASSTRELLSLIDKLR